MSSSPEFLLLRFFKVIKAESFFGGNLLTAHYFIF